MSTIEDATEAAPSENNTELVYAWAAVDGAEDSVVEGPSWRDRLTWTVLVAAVIVTAAAVAWLGLALYRAERMPSKQTVAQAAAVPTPPPASAPVRAVPPAPTPTVPTPGPAAAHETPPPAAPQEPEPPLMPYDTPDDQVALGNELCSELDEWGSRGPVVHNIMSPPGALTRAQADEQVDAAIRNFCPRNRGM